MLEFAIIDSLGAEPAFLCCGLGFNKILLMPSSRSFSGIVYSEPRMSLLIPKTIKDYDEVRVDF